MFSTRLEPAAAANQWAAQLSVPAASQDKLNLSDSVRTEFPIFVLFAGTRRLQYDAPQTATTIRTITWVDIGGGAEQSDAHICPSPPVDTLQSITATTAVGVVVNEVAINRTANRHGKGGQGSATHKRKRRCGWDSPLTVCTQVDEKRMEPERLSAAI